MGLQITIALVLAVILASKSVIGGKAKPFEIEEENIYEELLSENVLEIDENKHVNILKK